MFIQSLNCKISLIHNHRVSWSYITRSLDNNNASLCKYMLYNDISTTEKLFRSFGCSLSLCVVWYFVVSYYFSAWKLNWKVTLVESTDNTSSLLGVQRSLLYKINTCARVAGNLEYEYLKNLQSRMYFNLNKGNNYNQRKWQ